MYASTLTAWAVALAIVVAHPFSLQDRSTIRRDVSNDTLTVNSNGNIHVTYETINIGTLPLTVLGDKIHAQCGEQGPCDFSPQDISGYQLIGQEGTSTQPSINEVVTLQVQGSYAPQLQIPLLTAMGAVLEKVANCTSHWELGPCEESPNPSPVCNQQNITGVDCVVPKFWGVNYREANDTSNDNTPSIGATLEVQYPGDPGFCALFPIISGFLTGAIGAVPGIVTAGAPADALSLATLNCGTSASS